MGNWVAGAGPRLAAPELQAKAGSSPLQDAERGERSVGGPSYTRPGL